MKEKTDYGVDAPGVVRNLYIGGLVLVVSGLCLPPFIISGITINLRVACLAIAFGLMAAGTLMLLYAKKGKFRHRDRMIGMVRWAGTETVLDIGTGQGLLLIGAAKHLTSGRAIGIDIWSARDLSGNTAEKTALNAAEEGVADRIEVRNENICSTDFPNGYFDVILSNLCLHNIEDKEQRLKACTEICRILKPGGVAIISDFRNLSEYAGQFQRAGLTTENAGTYFIDTYVPLTIIKAVRIK